MPATIRVLRSGKSKDNRVQLKSHKASWHRRPSFPQVRFGDGHSAEFLVVGDAWSFELPAKSNERFGSVRHFANVVLREHLHDKSQLTCYLIELNTTTFRQIAQDPTRNWVRITRHGVGRGNTRYTVEMVRPATKDEIDLVQTKIPIDLELAAADKQAGANRRR